MKCSECGGPMKPLLTGMYCVNECDLDTFDDEFDLGDWGETTQPTLKQYVLGGDDWLLIDDSEKP